jgi:CubicO group peptidase (beta-lactamase class C family)
MKTSQKYRKILVFNLILLTILSACKKDECEELGVNCPVASFTVDVDYGNSPVTVQFTNTSENAVRYVWDFGDGTTSDEKNPKHTFEYDPSTVKEKFFVRLDAYDKNGNSEYTAKNITCKKNVLTDNPRVSEFDLWLDNYVMRYFYDPFICGMSMAFINGDQVSIYHYGETKQGNGILPDDNTLYQIASVTKTFTSMAVISWLNQNGVNLDTPVKHYLPDSLASGLSLDGVEVTFRHLLSHTSGFPRVPDNMPNNLGPDPYSGYDSLGMYEFIDRHPLIRTPGIAPQTVDDFIVYYGNFAYGLLGTILERQVQKNLQNIFEDYILTINDMNHSTIDDIENYTNIAYPNSKKHQNAFWHFESMAGAGAMNSNITDLIKYARLIFSADESTELGRAILDGFEPQYRIQSPDIGDTDLGLPWFMSTLSTNDILVNHGGNTTCFTTDFFVDRTNQKAIIIVNNNDAYDNSYYSFFDWDFILEFFDPPAVKRTSNKKDRQKRHITGDILR